MNEPLTIYFVGGFFYGASLAPGFRQDLRVWLVGVDAFLYFCKDNIGEMLGCSNTVVTAHYYDKRIDSELLEL